eukprot:g18596.t1
MADIQANLPDGLKQIRDKFGDAVKIVGINQDRNSEFIDKFDDVIKMLSLGSQEQILGRLAEKIQSDFDSGKISRECFNQAKGSMDLESVFAKKEYSQQRVVTNSKGVTLETKSANELWELSYSRRGYRPESYAAALDNLTIIGDLADILHNIEAATGNPFVQRMVDEKLRKFVTDFPAYK